MPKGIFGAYLEKSGSSYKGVARVPSEFVKPSLKEKTVLEEVVMESLQVPGEHMRANVLNASLAMYLMGVAPAQICTVMGQWKGIPHRLEKFYDWKSPSDGRKVVFYNDSCSTVPEACAAAIQSFDQRVVLIAGGTDKGLDFLPLARCLDPENNTKFPPYEIYLLSGTGTDKLVSMLDERGVKYEGPFDSLQILLDVLKTCLMSENASRNYGEVFSDTWLPVVFSPGATSFGMFSNEFDRGDKFKSLVKSIF